MRSHHKGCVCVGGRGAGRVFNGAQQPPIIRHASLNPSTYYANALLYYGEDFFFCIIAQTAVAPEEKIAENNANAEFHANLGPCFFC